MNCNDLKSVYIDRTGDWVRSGNDTGKFYLKEEVDAAIDELKTENESLLQQNRELCLALQVMYSKEEYDKQKAKADKLLSCLKILVMRDLIKDCPPKEVATEIVKEYDNGLG